MMLMEPAAPASARELKGRVADLQASLPPRQVVDGVMAPYGTLTYQNVSARALDACSYNLHNKSRSSTSSASDAKVSTLIIRSCPDLEFVPGSLYCLGPGLTALDLSHNAITELTSGIGKLTGKLSLCVALQARDALLDRQLCSTQASAA
eukprot:COSAG05_NODE_2224_length_3369_cov_40.171254_4_plen_150_part_00